MQLDLAALTAARPLVADGPMGTALIDAGMQAGDSAEAWLLEPTRRPAIGSVHRAYADAGARLLLTATFGADPWRLARSGLDDRLEEIVAVAVGLARHASAPGGLVAGSIGPSGELLEPLGLLDRAAAADGFGRQAAALAAAGVDLLWVETMSDLGEALAALEGARRAAPGLPVIVTMAFDRGGRTSFGVDGPSAGRTLVDAGAAAVGGNCGGALGDVEAAVGAMLEAGLRVPVVVKPNAGIPVMSGGRLDYPEGPASTAAMVARLLVRGAAVAGVCCGGTAEHVRAIAEAAATAG
jgi:5-methyltetrahydrofolate--homocysteine methyltransferase